MSLQRSGTHLCNPLLINNLYVLFKLLQELFYLLNMLVMHIKFKIWMYPFKTLSGTLEDILELSFCLGVRVCSLCILCVWYRVVLESLMPCKRHQPCILAPRSPVTYNRMKIYWFCSVLFCCPTQHCVSPVASGSALSWCWVPLGKSSHTLSTRVRDFLARILFPHSWSSTNMITYSTTANKGEATILVAHFLGCYWCPVIDVDIYRLIPPYYKFKPIRGAKERS